MSDYRSELFTHYERHVGAMDPDDATKQAWFSRHFDAHYRPVFAGLPAAAAVLEVGCNNGFFLRELARAGFTDLHGIDMSPDAVSQAKARVPAAKIECGDASAYLDARAGRFDAVVLKAVLEHVPKDRVISLLSAIAAALKPGGRAIVEVPNMDWLFASHERYMDFTHEGGFTAESLRQVMSQAFSTVEVHPIDTIQASSALSRLKIKLARFALTKALAWADPEGASFPVWSRALIAVGTAPRRS